jgi:multidrug efflux pump subunit AcrA (membrane-fusion protein)
MAHHRKIVRQSQRMFSSIPRHAIFRDDGRTIGIGPALARDDAVESAILVVMDVTPSRADEVIDETWSTVERLTDELVELSRRAVPPEEFHAALLSRALAATAAPAAAVWTRDQTEFCLAHHVNVVGTALDDAVRQSGHIGLLEAGWRSGKTQLVLPRAGGTAADAPHNPTDLMLLLGPIRVEEQTVGLIEIFQRPTSHPQAQQTYLSLLAALGEAAADFCRNHELRALRAARTFWEQTEAFSRRIHSAGGLQATGYALVNEGRRLLGCDRVSLAARRGSRCVMLAVSGVERVQRRSCTIRLLERLGAMAVATGEPLRYDGGGEPQPPEVERVLQQYLDEAHVRGLAVVPLRGGLAGDSEPPDDDQPPVGVLIAERFDARRDPEFGQRLSVVCRHSALALRNALRQRHALRRGWDWLGQAGVLVKTAVAGMLLAAVLAVAILVPADFDIEARGELLPRHRQDVFAPVDGEVRELAVEHDSPVRAGQLLVELRSATLELQYERLTGEHRTTQQKLLAAQSERAHGSSLTAEDRRRLANWSATEKELEKQLEGIQQQLQVVQRQLAQLKVVSPLSGRVQTWDVRQLLDARPVARGQVLLTVAEVDGPWVLELKLPDHHVSHVRAAQQRTGTPLEVAFLLKTDPAVRYRGTLERVAMTTTSDDRGETFVQIVVALDDAALPALRSGAAVVAWIHCGRAALGYVWLHDLIDAVRTWMFF